MDELKDTEDFLIIGFNSLCFGHYELHLPHLVKLQKQYILKCNVYTEIHISPVVNYLLEDEAKHYCESNILGLLVGWRDTARMVMRCCWHIHQCQKKHSGLYQDVVNLVSVPPTAAVVRRAFESVACISLFYRCDNRASNHLPPTHEVGRETVQQGLA